MTKCTKCNLYKGCRTVCIKLDGDKNSEVLFVGEAPGADEDLEGRPFMGRSGSLLRVAIAAGFPKNFQAAFANVVRCRPHGNREPTPDEVAACKEYLDADLESMPNLRIVVAVGNVALRALFGRQGITKHSGKIVGEVEGLPGAQLFALLHPAYILRNQPESKKFYEHVARIASCLKGGLIDESERWRHSTIRTAEDFDSLLNGIQHAGYFVYDIETNGLSPYREGSYIKCISLSFKEGETFTIPVDLLNRSDELQGTLVALPQQETLRIKVAKGLKEIFESKRIGKIGHNIKFDNGWINTKMDATVRSTIWDTAISQFLLNEIEGVGLKDLAWKYTKWGGYEKKLPTGPENMVPGVELYDYCATDVDVSHIIYAAHKLELPKDKQIENVFKTLLIPVSNVLLGMENRGIRIDKQTILQTQAKVGTESQSLILSMRNLPSVLQYQSETSSDFNPNSHIQLRKILFGIEKLPITKYTDKTKAPSTDKEVLEELADSSALCGLLQQYNSFQSTRKFCDELLEEEVDSRIHTSYNLTIARTGRTSSKNPNMQNMPKGDKDPLGIRSCFVPDEGFLLVEADYNQHELRVLAEISGDSHLLKALQGDVHVATAATILGKQPANVTTEERRTVGKTFNFGLVYGMTSYGIMRRLGCSEGEAKNFLMRFFGEYSRVDKWMKEVELYVRKNHYVRTLSGRIRHFPSYDSLEDSNIREAINTPIQGTASDILLYSLIGIERFLKHNNLKSFLILQVHDSIVFNIHEDERACLPYIKGIMLNHFKKYMDFKSELQVDFKAGANWQDMKDIPV